jgi:hypothetical protein
MKKHTFNLTYVEGLLLLTNAVSVSALHRQHNVLADQNSVIKKFFRDLGRVNRKLLELKTVKTLDTGFVSTKVAETEQLFLSNFTSYLDPKILGGIVLVGAIYCRN